MTPIAEVRGILLDFAAKFDSRHSRHDDVCKHQIGLFIDCLTISLLSISCRRDVVSVLQRASKIIPQGGIVLGHENRNSFSIRCSCSVARIFFQEPALRSTIVPDCGFRRHLRFELIVTEVRQRGIHPYREILEMADPGPCRESLICSGARRAHPFGIRTRKSEPTFNSDATSISP